MEGEWWKGLERVVLERIGKGSGGKDWKGLWKEEQNGQWEGKKRGSGKERLVKKKNENEKRIVKRN